MEFFESKHHQNLNEQQKDKKKFDVIKQLTYELAVQQIQFFKIIHNCFLIPHYQESNTIDTNSGINIKGIDIILGNFSLIIESYLNNNEI